jgi:hypothetical protein
MTIFETGMVIFLGIVLVGGLGSLVYYMKEEN